MADGPGERLPPELIREILSYGSVEFVCQFRLVSRAWRYLSPRFINLHLQRSPAALLIQAYPENGSESEVYTYGGHQEQLRRLIRFPRYRFEDGDVVHKMEILVVRGIVVCSRVPAFTLFKIWNPATRRIHALPQPQIPYDENVHARVLVGAGLYNQSYKIIRILPRKDGHPNNYEVFSNGQWMQIFTAVNMVLLPGAIGGCIPYWRMLTVDATGDVRFRLVWFDGFHEPGNFRIENLPWPPNCRFRLGGLSDSLCALVQDSKNALSGLWIKVHPGTEGWVRLFPTVFSYLVSPVGIHMPTILGFCGERSIVIRYGESNTASICDMMTGDQTGVFDIPENRPAEAFPWRECLEEIPVPYRFVRV